MLKIFSSEIPYSRVNISEKISSPHKEQLLRARSVIDNYLKNTKCKVSIGNCPLHQGDWLQISAFSDSSLSRISVLKEGERPFLRKIYEAVEIVTNSVAKKNGFSKKYF